MMQRIKNAKLRLARGSQDLQHVRDTTIRFCDNLQAISYFAALGNEIVIGVDDDERGGSFSYFRFSIFFPPMRT